LACARWRFGIGAIGKIALPLFAAKFSKEKPMTTITLKKPVQAHGEDVTALTFRDPNGEDIMEAGYPILIQMDGKKPQIVVDSKPLGAMISRLANIPPASVKKLSLGDFNMAAGVVTGFFMDSIVETFSTAISRLGDTSAT
jgi:hypothetical protein